MPSATPEPFTQPLAGGLPGACVEVRRFVCGRVRVPRERLAGSPSRLARLRGLGLWPGGERVAIPILAFAVRHPRAGWLLVDTGLHPAVRVDPRTNLGRLGALALGDPELAPGASAAERLRALGVEPQMVSVVILTHLHLDHVSAAGEFAHALFVLDRAEWDAAFAAGPLEGYVRAQFDLAFSWRTIDFTREPARSHATFGRTFDLFGDGSVVLVSTPGHSAGHLSVLLRTRKRQVLVCGDAAGTYETLRSQAMPAIVHDRHLYERSLQELRLFAREYPQALLVPGHEPSFLAGPGDLAL